MQESKCLILFTNYYPYYKGEEYIENEIGIANQYYEKILIVPTMVSKTMKRTRQVPQGVKVLDVKTDCSIFGKAKMVLKQLIHVLKSKNFKMELNNNSRLGLKKLVYTLYYLCRVEDVYNVIVRDKEFQLFVENCDTVTLYSYWMHVVASITARVKERVFHDHVRSITRGHRYDLYDYAAPCHHIPEREYMLGEMDAVYPCSQDGVDYLKKRYPQFSDKISVERLGTLQREQITCSRDPEFVLVSCSGVRKVKRLDKIIKLIEFLLNKQIKVHWVHLGGGPELENVKKLAKKSLPDSAYEFIGQMTNQEIFDWYSNNNVSCFINLSDSEGVPVAIMEAMSVGIPVIATDVGGTKEIIEHGMNGYIIQKEDSIKKIAKYVYNMIKMDEPKYKDMSDASYLLWKERADAEKLYHEFYRLF